MAVSLLALGLGLGAAPATAADGFGPKAYVVNRFGNSVSVVDTGANTTLTTVPVGALPVGAAALPDGTRVYVGNNVSVSVIDTVTDTVVATIPLAGMALTTGLVASPDSTRVYVVHAGSLFVIDTASNTVIATVALPGGFTLAVTPDGAHLYVVNQGGGTVSVVSTVTLTVVTTIPVGMTPVGVAVSPSGTRAYVGNFASDSVSIIDTATNLVVATVALPGGPSYVAITPDGTRAYVARQTAGAVSVMDTTTNAIGPTIPTAPFAGGLAVTPDGSQVYATSFGAMRVFAISTATNTVTATPPVGLGTQVVAIALSCTQRLTGDLDAPLTVSAGQHLCLDLARVARGIRVQPGGALTVTRSDVVGGISATGATLVTLCGNRIVPAPRTSTAVGISGSTGSVRLGEPALGCAPNAISSSVVLNGNRASVVLAANQIWGGLTLTATSPGQAVVKANVIRLRLACMGNNPPPTDAGQPNTASGGKTGQCAML